VTATDLNIEACKFIDCEAKGEWSFLANGARLLNLFSGMTGQAEFEIDAQAERLTVRADGLELTLNLMMPPDDWPTFELQRPQGLIEIGEAVLHRALHLVTPCISSEETRYYLNGIFWTRDGEKSRMVTTNGHQLARLDLDCPAPPVDAIMPRTATTILQSMLTAKGNEAVQLVHHENSRVTFSKGLYSLRTKLIDGIYPDYTRVIPADTGPIDVVITRETARRLLAVTDECSKACKISPAKAEVSVKLQNEGELRIPIGTQAKDGDDIGFHAPYLATLTRCAGDLRIRAKDKAAAARLTNEANPDLLYILMPMRV
jgi:DNA polymerase-3 subunit beta